MQTSRIANDREQLLSTVPAADEATTAGGR